MRRLGFAAGLSVFFETSAFGAMTMIAGLIGPVAVAAYSIAHNVEATVFMAALGLAVATGVKVGREFGGGRRHEAAFVGWTGLAAAACLMAGLGALVGFNAEALARFYSKDAAVAAMTLTLLSIVAVSVIPDGMQIVSGQSNRAVGDAYVSSALYFAAFWLVMVPLGAVFGLGLGWGPEGLMIATLIGASASAALQAGRFRRLTRG
jgi:MATE family multidrug resistance protein